MKLIEFAYNWSVHGSTKHSPFEIVYGFNPTSPMNLLPRPIHKRINDDGEKKAKLVKSMHKEVRKLIKKKNEKYSKVANKKREQV